MNPYPTKRQLDIVAVVRSLAVELRTAPTTSAVARRLAITDRGARRQLESLEKKGLLSNARGSHSRWAVTETGLAWLDTMSSAQA